MPISKQKTRRATSIDVEPVTVTHAYRIVADQIIDKVMSGEWPVGMSLPGEVALADAFGVARSTIREVIRVLEQEGMMSRPRGTKQLLVKAPSVARVATRMKTALILREVTFFELWETMLALEPVSAEGAARNATADHIAKLNANQKAKEEAVHDQALLTKLDLEFLDIIALASGNHALQLCRVSFAELLYAAFRPVFELGTAGPRLVAAHKLIIEAIVNRDEARAFQAMRWHIEDFRRGYERAGLDGNAPVANFLGADSDLSPD